MSTIGLRFLNSNSIREKWDVNWWRRYGKCAHEYCVGFYFIFKTQMWKDTFPCLLPWEWAENIQIWNYLNDNLLYKKPKVVLLKPTPTIIIIGITYCVMLEIHSFATQNFAIQFLSYLLKSSNIVFYFWSGELLIWLINFTHHPFKW